VIGNILSLYFYLYLQKYYSILTLINIFFPSSQAILACSFAEKDYKKTTAAAIRTLQMAFVLGMGLSLTVGLGLYFGAGIFSRNIHVVHLIKIGLPVINKYYFTTNQQSKPWYLCFNHNYLINFIHIIIHQFVAATQPINSLAFVFDGVNYGASDFAYAACSLVSSHMPFFILYHILHI